MLVREQLEEWGETVGDWRDAPVKGDPNPYAAEDPSRPWPPTGIGAEAQRRLDAAAMVRAADPTAEDDALDMVESARVADWDAELERLLVEARAERSAEIEVPLPGSLSATALLRLQDDPDAFAQELARPMPRPPSRAARFGTLFHAWVEDRFKQQPLLDPDDLPGRADLDIADESDLDAVIAAFEKGPFADLVPHAVEASFALVLAGQVVRGRIDAVYDEPDGGWLVVDWKTNRNEDADPLQLAIYRARVGRAPRRTAREGARRVPLRADRQDRRAGRPAGPSGAGGHARARERPATRRRRGQPPGPRGWRRWCWPRGRSRPAAPAGRRRRWCRRAGCRRTAT